MNDFDINLLNPIPIHVHKMVDSSNRVGLPFGKRDVKCYEIELITKTGGWIMTQDEKIYAVEGDVFFRKPGMIVQGFSGYSAYLIAFDATYCRENKSMYNLINPFDTSIPPLKTCFDISLPYKINFADYLEQKKQFNDAYELYINGNSKKFIILKSLLLQILSGYIYKSYAEIPAEPSGKYSHHYQEISNSQKYIRDNIRGYMSLDNLAKSAGLSKNFYCKVFKSIVGMTAFEYINQERVRLARLYLLTGYLPIEEIMALCGFSDSSYFYRLFKRYTGDTPLQYRKKSNQPYYLAQR
jgi:AraC-like DNA-binding protein